MRQNGFTVYVIDDDESMRKSLKRLLSSFGYHVVAFESAEDFLRSATENEHGCLLLDIQLPAMSGLDLLERLSAAGANYAVILMTAHENEVWRQRAKKANAVAYLLKPFDEKSLLDVIQLACNERAGPVGEEVNKGKRIELGSPICPPFAFTTRMFS